MMLLLKKELADLVVLIKKRLTRRVEMSIVLKCQGKRVDRRCSNVVID